MKWQNIIIHSLAWLVTVYCLYSFSLSWGWTISNEHDSLLPQIYGAITNAFIFYFTSFFLIPKYYNSRKFRVFFMLLVLCLLLVSLVELSVDLNFAQIHPNKSYQYALSLSKINFYLDGFIYIISVNIAYVVLAFVYRIPKDRRSMHEKQLNLQSEKLEAELKYLKAQVHPHTLFNGLNSIYHLVDQNPEKSKKLILNLSNALRYHLYDSPTEFGSLEKEVDYLKEYVALYTARVEDDVNVSFHTSRVETKYVVAPFLLTPFIENAFKYVSHFSEKDKNHVEISISVENDLLIFSCSNTIDGRTQIESSQGGIGLKNVKNRLNLLYSNLYELIEKSNEDRYDIILSIPLKSKS